MNIYIYIFFFPLPDLSFFIYILSNKQTKEEPTNHPTRQRISSHIRFCDVVKHFLGCASSSPLPMAFLSFLPHPAQKIALCGTKKQSQRLATRCHFLFFPRPLHFSCVSLRDEWCRRNGPSRSECESRGRPIGSLRHPTPAKSSLSRHTRWSAAIMTREERGDTEGEGAVGGSRRSGGKEPLAAGRGGRPWRHWSLPFLHPLLRRMRWEEKGSMTIPMAYYATRPYSTSSSPSSCVEDGSRGEDVATSVSSSSSSPSPLGWEAESKEQTMALQALLREERSRRGEGGGRGRGVAPPQTSVHRLGTQDDRVANGNTKHQWRRHIEEAPVAKGKEGIDRRAHFFSSSSSSASPPSAPATFPPSATLGCHFFSSPPLLYLPNTNGGERTPRHALREQLTQHPTLLTSMQQFLNLHSEEGPSPSSRHTGGAHEEEEEKAYASGASSPPLLSRPTPPQWMIVGCHSIPYLRRQLRRSEEDAFAMAMHTQSPSPTSSTHASSLSLPFSGDPSRYRHQFLIVHHSLETIVQLAAALLPLSSNGWTDETNASCASASVILPHPSQGEGKTAEAFRVPPSPPDTNGSPRSASSLFAPSLRFLRCSELFFPLLHLFPAGAIDTAVFPMPVPFGSAKASYRRVLHHDLLVALHPVLRTRRTKDDGRGVMVFTDSSAYAGFIVEELEASKFLVPWSRKRVTKPTVPSSWSWGGEGPLLSDGCHWFHAQVGRMRTSPPPPLPLL